MNKYETKQESRRQHYENLAQKSAEKADRLAEESFEMCKVIPFGQPILVGHHSERRDRNYRAAMGRKMDKASEFNKKAEYYAAKAASVGKGGISSDDHEAIEKLTAQLNELQQKQVLMKVVNKAVKIGDFSKLAELGLTEEEIAERTNPEAFGGMGYATFELRNNSANIRRLQKRINSLEAIKKQAATRAPKVIEEANFTFREDFEENRLMFFFGEKPSQAICKRLKQSGFKWSPTRGAWIRQITNNAYFSANDLIRFLREQQ